MELINTFSTVASITAVAFTLISSIVTLYSMRKVSKKQDLEIKRLMLTLRRSSAENELKEIEKEISRLQKSLEKDKKAKEKLLGLLSSIQESASLSHEQRTHVQIMYKELSSK